MQRNMNAVEVDILDASAIKVEELTVDEIDYEFQEQCEVDMLRDSIHAAHHRAGRTHDSY